MPLPWHDGCPRRVGIVVERPTIIYDGECKLCRAAVSGLRSGAFDLLPYQSPNRAERFPDISSAQCEQAMQLATPDGRVLSGVDALPDILAATPGSSPLTGDSCRTGPQVCHPERQQGPDAGGAPSRNRFFASLRMTNLRFVRFQSWRTMGRSMERNARS